MSKLSKFKLYYEYDKTYAAVRKELKLKKLKLARKAA